MVKTVSDTKPEPETEDRGVTTRDSPEPYLAVLPDDMPDTRLLVELESHASDLSEASHALGHAIAAGEDSPLWLPLTSHAATAYIRPFIHSNVRRRLDEMPDVPAMPSSMKALHGMIRQFRNTTVAHSQSTLLLPLPAVVLGNTGKPTKAAPFSVVHHMPPAIAEKFAALIAAMEDAVEEATRPVLERLRIWLKDQAAEDVAKWAPPDIVHATALEFNAADARTHPPRFTVFWQEQLPSDEQAPGQLS